MGTHGNHMDSSMSSSSISGPPHGAQAYHAASTEFQSPHGAAQQQRPSKQQAVPAPFQSPGITAAQNLFASPQSSSAPRTTPVHISIIRTH